MFGTMIGDDGFLKVDHKVVDAHGFFHERGLPHHRLDAVGAPGFIFRKLMECFGVMMGLGVSGLWLASVVLVIRAAVGQQAYHSVTLGIFWIWVIVVSYATLHFGLARQPKVMAKGGPWPCWHFSRSPHGPRWREHRPRVERLTSSQGFVSQELGDTAQVGPASSSSRAW